MIFSVIKLILLLVISAGCTQTAQDMSLKKHDIKENDPGNYPVEKSEEEWQSQLDNEQYHVLRRAGTERPFTGSYYQTDSKGIYFSAASGQPLFVSDAKYDSGCGWPSFFEPILPEAVYYRTDRKFGMIRTEIIDSGSGSHLGHVFNDGPPPTYLRYCLNSAAMIFVKQGDPLPERVREYMDNYASEEEKNAVVGFFKNAD